MGTQTCDSAQAPRLQSSITHDVDPVERTQQPALRVIHARGIADAFEVIRVVRSNQAVLLNCRQLASQRGSRLIDICSGGVCALDGQIHRISVDVVLFAPALSRVSLP